MPVVFNDVTLDPEKTYIVKSYEIVIGHPEEEVPGARHSNVCGRLIAELVLYLRDNRIGELYPTASFQIGKSKCIPDLAFISTDRIPAEGAPKTKWLIPPDLAIEVVSPNDFYEDVYAKAMDYLTAGVKQVWIVLPGNRTITIYRSATNITAFPPESELVSEDLLPGFRCRLSEIFKPLAKAPE